MWRSSLRGIADLGLTKRSNRWSASFGPGPASGWYWTVAPCTSLRASPSTVRSYRLMWVSSAAPKSVSQRTASSSSIVLAPFGPSTAKPWFWLVISTIPVVRSLTGWLAPWWPNGSL